MKDDQALERLLLARNGHGMAPKRPAAERLQTAEEALQELERHSMAQVCTLSAADCGRLVRALKSGQTQQSDTEQTQQSDTPPERTK